MERVLLAQTKWPTWGKWCLLLSLSIVGSVIFFRWAKGNRVGSNDFSAYWSASRLFLEGRNPYDQENLSEMQLVHLGSNKDGILMVWNPPTVWIFLLPVSWMPFETARVVWLLINIVLVLVSCFILRQIYFPMRTPIVLLVYCLTVVTFAPVLIAIIIGQITFLVLFGLTTSLFFIKHERWFWAGAMLIFITPKPHLVMLAAPYLMLYMAVHRKWRGWLGLGVAGVACVVILFALRPAWIADFSLILKNPPVRWLTPTLGGVLKSHNIGAWGQYFGLAFLLLLPRFLRQPEILPVESVVSLLTLITVPSTFFGWSFDQSILLIPMAEIIYWLSDPLCSNKMRWGLSLGIAIVLLANLVQHMVAKNEVDYFWVSIAWGGIYALAWWEMNRRRQASFENFSE